MEKRKKKNRIITYSSILFLLILLSIIGIGSKYMGYGSQKENNEFLLKIKTEFEKNIFFENVSMAIEGNELTFKYEDEIYTFLYENNILTTTYDSNNKYSIEMSKIMLDLISVSNGHSFGETYIIYSKMPTQDVTLDFGFEYIFGKETTAFKINTNTSITNIPNSSNPIYALDLVSKKEEMLNGNFSYKKNNVSFSVINLDKSIKTITIKETPGLTTDTYNSIIGIINTIYDKKLIDYFNKNYLSLSKKNFEIPGLKIEYSPNKTNMEEALLGEEVYEYIRLTIDTTKINSN